ncbi:cytochrome P450 CYP82D47-like [Quercus robur]|uniref:cytochrome P450 CYP82D47-like n=1 Tax=Quercus robur TaxID=38942 RepID=UPI002163F7D5|nr:cytochrome P450 CYP82D47-like [Quercus robur]
MTSMASVFIIFKFVFFLLWISRIFQRAASKKRVPPKAGGARPLIGHLHLLGGSEPPHITLGKMADKYGPIFTIWLGVHRTLVVSSWEIAKECFTTNDKAFANRPKGVAPEVLGYNYAMIVFSPYGPFWRQVRKIATLEVLSNHRLETFKHIREAEVNDSLKEIYKLLGKNNKVLVEMERWFGYTVLNVICRIVVGKRFGRATSKEENEANDRCRKTFRVFSDLSGEFMFADALPCLRWLDVGGYEKAMKKIAKEVDHMVGVWLEEHKQKKLSSELKEHQDFMDVLLSIVTEDDDEFSSYDVDTIVKATITDLILAASETSTMTLTWALSLLLNNREALTKAQEELDIQIGKDRQVKESDLKNLVYLQAIIKETMRLYPAAPLLVPHESMEDCTLAGYHIPAGTRLLVNASKLQRDPNVWEDPNKFKPEKFLTTHKGVDVRGQNFELIPFGSGRRMCPGISFALQITQLKLATLLHAFEIATPSHEPMDMTGKGGLTNQKATPLEVHLTPRFHAQIYA